MQAKLPHERLDVYGLHPEAARRCGDVVTNAVLDLKAGPIGTISPKQVAQFRDISRDGNFWLAACSAPDAVCCSPAAKELHPVHQPPGWHCGQPDPAR